MKRNLFLLLLFIGVIIIHSCRQDKHIPDVCFNENVLPIFINKCSNPGCHNPSDKAAGIDLTNYTSISQIIKAGSANRSKLYQNIKGKNPSMPPKTHTALTDKEINYIKYWIDFGGENTSCSSSSCDTLSYITYSNSIKSIIDQNCGGCHAAGIIPGQALDSYAGVKSSIQGGLFIPAIKHTGSKPMPQGGNKLSACSIAKIDKWILAGMPE